MNTTELKKILDEHKVYIESFHERGSRANLSGADLRGADLSGANLSGADLYGANLPDHTNIIMGEEYFVSIANGESVRAGCQIHSIEDWRKFTKAQIADMDGRRALRFYPRLLDLIDFFVGKGERPEWLKEPQEDEAA